MIVLYQLMILYEFSFRYQHEERNQWDHLHSSWGEFCSPIENARERRKEPEVRAAKETLKPCLQTVGAADRAGGGAIPRVSDVRGCEGKPKGYRRWNLCSLICKTIVPKCWRWVVSNPRLFSKFSATHTKWYGGRAPKLRILCMRSETHGWQVSVSY